MIRLNFYFKVWIGFIGIATIISCNSKVVSDSSTENRNTKENVIDSLQTPAKHLDHTAKHYWDQLDMTDTALIHKPDVLEQHFVNYLVTILSNISTESAKESMDILMERVSKTPAMQNYIVGLFERYLYVPDSPYRNENLYIPFLEILTKLPTARTEDIIVGKYRLKMALKNRPGMQATDFVYMDRYGQQGKLSGIKNSYILLIFYDPDCENCHKSIQRLASLAVSNDPHLKIVSIYPDESVDKWRTKINDLPENWINGYSPDGEITKKELYDVRAWPTFYLLDKDKKVILKDPAEMYLLEYLHQGLLPDK